MQLGPINCVVAGDGGVGKTALLYTYTNSRFPDEYMPTIFDDYSTTVTLDGDQVITLILWDLNGLDEYVAIRHATYINADPDVFLVFFSIDNPFSFKNVSANWIPDVRRYCPNVPVILVGTKLDLRYDDRIKRMYDSPITYQQGLQLMKEIGAMKYVECSALTMTNVKAVFDEAVQTVLSSSDKYAYYRGIKDGYVHLTSKKLVLMGPPCVGKTAFKYFLFNWPAPKDHHSTAIASRPIRAMERVTDKNEGKVWDVVNLKEVFSMLTDAIQAKKETSESLPEASQLPNFESPLPASATDGNVATDSSTKPEAVADEVTDGETPKTKSPQSLPDYSSEIIQRLADKKKKKSKELHKATWIHVLDSGGQPQFADISRAFLRGNALNVIVIKLTEKLADKPNFAYSLNGRLINVPSELAMTNIQLIEHFVRSVAASKSTTVRIGDNEIVSKPFFIVIGTYYDQAMKGVFKKKEAISESIADKNQQILTVLHEFREHLIFYNDASNELIFPVDNLCRINRKKLSSQIRERIMAQEGVGFKVPIPVRWYMFELHIREIASSEEHGIVSLESCCDIGKKLSMNVTEVNTSLKYLDSLTLCLYYDKLLPNVIFTNPQYLLDLLSNLVRVSFVTVLDEIVPEGRSLSADTQRLLREDGVFEMSLLDNLGLPFVPSLFTKDDFLKLLRYIQVIAPITSNDSVQRYYMPIVLPPDQLHLTDDDKQVFMGTCDPVIIEFKMKFVPQGIFPSLVVSLVGRKEKPLFFIDSRSPAFPRQLRYAVKLYSDDLCGSVLLLDRFKYIEVYFTGFPKGCPALYDAIREAIVSCGQLLGYNETQLETNVTLSCQRAHRLASIAHALKVTQHDGRSYGSCTLETELPPLLLTERQLCWLNGPEVTTKPLSYCLPNGVLNEGHAPVVLSVLTDLVDEWEILGIHLGLENSVLQEIKYNSLHQAQICRKEMVVRWLQGGSATREELISALVILERGDIIAKLQSVPTE